MVPVCVMAEFRAIVINWAPLTWDGGAMVVAWRGLGLAAMFKRTLSLHDPLVTTLRGSSMTSSASARSSSNGIGNRRSVDPKLLSCQL